jgi:hypothetical protein
MQRCCWRVVAGSLSADPLGSMLAPMTHRLHSVIPLLAASVLGCAVRERPQLTVQPVTAPDAPCPTDRWCLRALVTDSAGNPLPLAHVAPPGCTETLYGPGDTLVVMDRQWRPRLPRPAWLTCSLTLPMTIHVYAIGYLPGSVRVTLRLGHSYELLAKLRPYSGSGPITIP